jgi:hypothetical protein
MEPIWPIWAVAIVLVATGKGETTIITLSGLPWWHRASGGIAAGAFYSARLWSLIGR